MDNQYTRISKNDEGNIGGTLSNNLDAHVDEAADAVAAAEDGAEIIGFGEELQQVDA